MPHAPHPRQVEMHDDEPNRPFPEADDSAAGSGRPSDIPALALGALDDSDLEPALREIQESDQARAELARYEEIVGSLGLAAPAATPPLALRESILAGIVAAPVPIESEREARRAPLAWVGLAAAVLVIATLGLTSLAMWSRADDRGETIDRLEATVEQQEQRIVELEAAARSAGVWVNFEQPLVWTPLEVTAGNGQAEAFLCRTPDGAVAYLVITGMPIASDQVFQAWLIEDTPVPVGTMRPDAEGRSFLILQHPGEPVQDFDVIGVTLEPPGGSPQPTSDPVMVGEIV
jgi:anti-sigma-K factor RskA